MDWSQEQAAPKEYVSGPAKIRIADDGPARDRASANGSIDGNPFHLWAYNITTDPSKLIKSLSLPGNRSVLVFGVTLVPAGIGTTSRQ